MIMRRRKKNFKIKANNYIFGFSERKAAKKNNKK